MTATQVKTRLSLPGAGALTLGVLAAAATVLAAFLCLALPCLLYNRQLSTALQHSLASQDYETARRVGAAVLSPPPPFSIFSEASPPQMRIEVLNFELLIDLLQKVTARDFTAARELLSKRESEIAKYKTLSLSRAGQVIETITDELDPLETRSTGITAIESEIETKRNILKEIHHTYRGLQTEFAQLLSLDSGPDSGENEVYQSGVLQGLPALERLPDGLTDLTELKLELQSIGGAVRIEAPNPFEIFASRIAELRNQTAALVHDGEEVAAAVQQLEEQSADLEAKIKIQSDAITELAQNRLVTPQGDLVERLKEQFLSFVTAVLRK